MIDADVEKENAQKIDLQLKQKHQGQEQRRSTQQLIHDQNQLHKHPIRIQDLNPEREHQQQHIHDPNRK